MLARIDGSGGDFSQITADIDAIRINTSLSAQAANKVDQGTKEVVMYTHATYDAVVHLERSLATLIEIGNTTNEVLRTIASNTSRNLPTNGILTFIARRDVYSYGQIYLRDLQPNSIYGDLNAVRQRLQDDHIAYDCIFVARQSSFKASAGNDYATNGELCFRTGSDGRTLANRVRMEYDGGANVPTVPDWYVSVLRNEVDLSYDRVTVEVLVTMEFGQAPFV